MKPVKKLIAAVFLWGTISICSLHASPTWSYVGLKGETVKSILSMIPNSPNGVMVGTQTGIWHFEYTWWYHSFSGLPVHDIIKIPGDRLLAAAGNGSDSDGVYLGTVTAIGEPGTRWGFSLLVKSPRPTALAFQALHMDTTCAGRVYVGNAEGVRSGFLCTGADKKLVCDLTMVSGPDHPFGSVCASMLVGSDDGMLYAGGYDQGIDPVPSSNSWLLRGNYSIGLAALKKMNVSSIIELPEQTIDSRPVRLVAVATIDSGIQSFDNGTPFDNGGFPRQVFMDSKIIDLALFDLFGTGTTRIVAATPSGVFFFGGWACDPTWLRYDLPGSPKCLAHHEGKMLWAGTDSGVYRYENIAKVDRKYSFGSLSGLRIQSSRTIKGDIVFRITSNDHYDGRVSVFDTRGRLVKTCIVAGKHTSISGIGKGLFFYKIAVNNTVVQAGRIASY
jgi:hypothetical protein